MTQILHRRLHVSHWFQFILFSVWLFFYVVIVFVTFTKYFSLLLSLPSIGTAAASKFPRIQKIYSTQCLSTSTEMSNDTKIAKYFMTDFISNRLLRVVIYHWGLISLDIHKLNFYFAGDSENFQHASCAIESYLNSLPTKSTAECWMKIMNKR